MSEANESPTSFVAFAFSTPNCVRIFRDPYLCGIALDQRSANTTEI